MEMRISATSSTTRSTPTPTAEPKGKLGDAGFEYALDQDVSRSSVPIEDAAARNITAADKPAGDDRIRQGDSDDAGSRPALDDALPDPGHGAIRAVAPSVDQGSGGRVPGDMNAGADACDPLTAEEDGEAGAYVGDTAAGSQRSWQSNHQDRAERPQVSGPPVVDPPSLPPTGQHGNIQPDPGSGAAHMSARFGAIQVRQEGATVQMSASDGPDFAGPGPRLNPAISDASQRSVLIAQNTNRSLLPPPTTGVNSTPIIEAELPSEAPGSDPELHAASPYSMRMRAVGHRGETVPMVEPQGNTPPLPDASGGTPRALGMAGRWLGTDMPDTTSAGIIAADILAGSGRPATMHIAVDHQQTVKATGSDTVTLPAPGPQPGATSGQIPVQDLLEADAAAQHRRQDISAGPVQGEQPAAAPPYPSDSRLPQTIATLAETPLGIPDQWAEVAPELATLHVAAGVDSFGIAGAASHAQPSSAHGAHAARQLAEAMILTGPEPGQTELVLSPEELGKVQFTISDVDGRLTVVISAERPETMTLLRRNAELLAAELAQSGMNGAALDFGGGKQPGDQSDRFGRHALREITTSTDGPVEPTGTERHSGAGYGHTLGGRLNIRL